MSSDRIGGLPLGTGAIAGAGAYLLGYVFTYLLVGSDVRESAVNQVFQALGGEDLTYQAVGWVFYNAHFVSTVVDVNIPFIGGSDTVNFIAQVDAFSAILYVVPVVLLFGAGLAVGRRTPGEQDVGDAAAAGATVVAGYLPLAVIVGFLIQVQTNGSSAGPDLLLAAVLAGLIYPAVFGALGSVAAFATQS
ncbi:hypothetical protein ACOZ4N_01670 [Halorientalis pallida]|uniref:hypothetical protein n=1 Tax=Halorientalis pallida TaxID=2479928 RepID=UPI003C70258D